MLLMYFLAQSLELQYRAKFILTETEHCEIMFLHPHSDKHLHVKLVKSYLQEMETLAAHQGRL